MSTLKVDAIRNNSATSDSLVLSNDGSVAIGTCTAKLTSVGGGQLSHRNIIVNGAMNINQRGSATTSTGYQTVDRFALLTNGVDEAVHQRAANLGSGDGFVYQSGFRKALKLTNGNQTSGAGASDAVYIRYRVEAQDLANSGWNYTSASSFITLQFLVKSSVAQNFFGYLETSDGTQKIYPFQTGSLSADTWTKIIVKIPGHSDLQFDNDNGQGMGINFAPFFGTQYTDNSAVVDTWKAYSDTSRMPDNTSTWYTTNDATWEITGVQLEVGDTATSFEHRSTAEELIRCYRYYYRMNGDNNKTYMAGMSDNDNQNIYGHFHFPVHMRTAPTGLDQNGTAGHYKVRRDTTKSCTGVPTFVDAMPFYARVNFPSSGHGWGTGQMLWLQGGSASSYLGFSAEL
tara:strand:+ start:340 stop:1539 length:1200 start_codon:yes stop_codon:yes gene_type:complete